MFRPSKMEFILDKKKKLSNSNRVLAPLCWGPNNRKSASIMNKHESIHQETLASALTEKIQINNSKEWQGWGGSVTGLNIKNWNWSASHLSVLAFNPTERQRGDCFWWSHRQKRSKCRELNTATFINNKTHLKIEPETQQQTAQMYTEMYENILQN